LIFKSEEFPCHEDAPAPEPAEGSLPKDAPPLSLPKELLSTFHCQTKRNKSCKQRFRELRAKSLPSIAMDGELIYESLIPGQEELCEEIRRRYQTGS